MCPCDLPPQLLELAHPLQCWSVWGASRRLVGVSPLGKFRAPLQQLLLILGVRQLARAAVSSPQWTPTGARPGRSIQACLTLANFCRCVRGRIVLTLAAGQSIQSCCK